MSDLHSQIHDYVEATIERVDVEDVVAAGFRWIYLQILRRSSVGAPSG